jgi:peptidyl-prolyl cis-trans isomerase B (cyclophilin B)
METAIRPMSRGMTATSRRQMRNLRRKATATHGRRPYHSARRRGAAGSVAAVLLALGALACGDTVAVTPEPTAAFAWPSDPGARAVLHVKGMGVIEIDLYPSLAPANVENFQKLARDGFYDGTTFHRVIPDFMIQGGDPNTKDQNPHGDGHGGPGYTVKDEFSNAPHTRGVVAMANRARPNSGGSQFFIVHAEEATNLDGKYSVVGRVASGMEIVDSIVEVEVDKHGRWGPKDRPLEPVVIEKLELRPAS